MKLTECGSPCASRCGFRTGELSSAGTSVPCWPARTPRCSNHIPETWRPWSSRSYPGPRRAPTTTCLGAAQPPTGRDHSLVSHVCVNAAAPVTPSIQSESDKSVIVRNFAKQKKQVTSHTFKVQTSEECSQNSDFKLWIPTSLFGIPRIKKKKSDVSF